MNITRNLLIAVLMTAVTTVLLGIVYPLVVTGVAQAIFPEKANGQIITRDGRAIGSRLIGQLFTSPEYFHGRPSAAGSGYDAASSGGSNLGPTSRQLIEAVTAHVAAARDENATAPVPVDLVTTSGSGLDPHVSPAAASFQVPRVARARGISEADLRTLVQSLVETRQWGVLGEPRVNVLLLNLSLNEHYPRSTR